MMMMTASKLLITGGNISCTPGCRGWGEDCKAVLYYYRSDIGDDDSGWGFYNNKIAPFPSLSLSLALVAWIKSG